MPEIVKITRIGENTFDILVLESNKRQNYRVTRNYVLLTELGELMPLINCDDRAFSEIYLEIRQDLWRMMEESESQQNLQIAELQTA